MADNEPLWCAPCNAWHTSTYSGCHREQDEAARRAQGPTPGERMERILAEQKPPVFVPPVGARVRLDYVPGVAGDHGKIVEVLCASDHGEDPTHGPLIRLVWRGDGGNERNYLCRVSPLPASAIEVECPNCRSAAGAPCVWVADAFGVAKRGDPYVLHGEAKICEPRSDLFASLTGKDSDTSENGCVETGSRGGGLDTAGPVAGENAQAEGTGRAAGKAGNAESLPAAPSGFKPIACSVPGCGHLVEHRHRNTGIDPASDATPEFKAHCVRLNEAASMCGDHAELHVRAPKIAKLRTDLDRPLPKVQAAERIWPSTWRSPSWESDP